MDDKKLTVVTELHRQARRNYPRRKVQMRGVDETWQADLVQMIPYSKVRISKNKHISEKGYTPNWTTEIFTISQVKSTKPVTYKLKDYQDQPIEGGFYEEEISKVKYSDIYLIEKVLKNRRDEVFVKWLQLDFEGCQIHGSKISKQVSTCLFPR
ncbi:uncharacterized protein LOC122507653 [Leptopilina heterotoma]|uniref:uncharacterized protein LOC122507653 n=1 Tax=Leptopilina heterotoma TaxID=63436 RepID=UPI001CA932CD|nr:uncharacterized protein LOC122507653 [Leptopilina heterotoma]